MLHAVADSHLFIGGTEDLHGPWVEVKHLESLGSVGVSWRTVEVELYDDNDTGWVEVDKAARAPQPMQVVFALDATDPGQSNLWAAASSVDWFRFRLVLGDGQAREWAGPVISCLEVLDAANNAMVGQASIAINTAIHRSEA